MEHLNTSLAVYLDWNDFESAEDILENMFATNIDQEYCELLEIYINLLQETDGIYSLKTDSVSDAAVRSFLETDSRSAVLAKSMLRKVHDEYFPEFLPELGDPEEEMRQQLFLEPKKYTDKVNNTIKVYPNPSTGMFDVTSLPGEYLKKLQVMDLSGRILKDEKIAVGLNKVTLHLKDISPGFYFLKCNTINRQENVKIEIIK